MKIKKDVHSNISEGLDREKFLAISNSDAGYDLGTYRGEDFLVVDSWEDLQKIQKVLNPEFIPKDKYDSSVIYSVMNDNWGFSDEYDTCADCANIIKISDSCDYFADMQGVHCEECVQKNPEDYIEYLINNYKAANSILSKDYLTQIGFVEIESDYASGLYDKHDSPEKILNKIKSEHEGAEILFNIDSNSPFEVEFSVWARGIEKDVEEENLSESNKCLNEYRMDPLQSALINILDYLNDFKDIYEFPKAEFLSYSWKDTLDGIKIGMDDFYEVAEGVEEYLRKIIAFNKKHPEILEDDYMEKCLTDLYDKLTNAMKDYLERYTVEESASSNSVLKNGKNNCSLVEDNNSSFDFASFIKEFGGDSKFLYQLLSRLESDCKYYLGTGNRADKHLWASSVPEQISMMRKIYDALPEKPEWLTKEDIDNYEKAMTSVVEESKKSRHLRKCDLKEDADSYWTAEESSKFYHGTNQKNNPNYGVSLDNFFNACVACGGNWTAMLLTGIKELFPEYYEEMPDRDYSFEEVAFMLNNDLGIDTAKHDKF